MRNYASTNLLNTNKPQLLFAETTIYAGGKGSRDKTYSSNIMVRYNSKFHKEKQQHPLYQIYYAGYKRWGLWKSPYCNSPWEKPQFYCTLESALKQANKCYLEDNLENEDLVISEKAKITYSKEEPHKGKNRWNYEIIEEETSYSLKAE